jgi:uncharacterized protein YbjQ (UPF0145 family)
MGYFDAPGDDERRAGADIPFEAKRRLQVLRAGDSLFTSGLSVGEFALLGEMEVLPVAQVMGASVFQVGYQYLPAPTSWQYLGSPIAGQQVPAPLPLGWRGTVTYELGTIGRAWDHARRRALDRLTEEALIVEADAVVGVQLRRGEHDWARGSVDYMVTGTAVRFPGSARASWPVLTDLSVQDYWKLRHAGYASVGLVATTAVVFVYVDPSSRWRRRLTFTQSQELPEISKALFAARDTARGRALGQARDNRADGIVGMTFEQHVRREEFKFESLATSAVRSRRIRRARVRSYDAGASDQGLSGLVITFHAVGTAIRHAARLRRYPPETVASLSAGV